MMGVFMAIAEQDVYFQEQLVSTRYQHVFAISMR